MKVGIGTEEGVVIGPLVNSRAVDKVDRDMAHRKGTQRVWGAVHQIFGLLSWGF